MEWKLKPDSDGDWLWVIHLPCECCIDMCGIAFVLEGEVTQWDGAKPPYNGEYLNMWLKLPNFPLDTDGRLTAPKQ